MAEQDKTASSPKPIGKKSAGKNDASNATSGVDVIRSYLASLQNTPGVYRMVNEVGRVLYVGKAKSLRKRVANYTNLNNQSNRIRRMVSETVSMEFVTTHTEAEALLLESNLIKRYAPRYNILLRDDKSFPQILITGGHDFAQILKHRGAQKRKGEYFGPFASVSAVNETLAFLQRVFLLRTCTDSVFEARTRPCLLYQIKRCSGPCDGRISKEDYGELVDQGRAFLSGRSNTIQQDLAAKMQSASDKQKYEEAAQYRDRIQALTRIQAHQDINLSGMPPTDVIAIHQDSGNFCIQIFFYRGGRNYGNRAYFPAHSRDEIAEVVLEAFLGQFYAQTPPPGQLLLSQKIPNRGLVSEALGIRAEGRVHIRVPTRGDKRKLVAHAQANARAALSRRLAESATQRKLLDDLGQTLGLDSAPERIEVYDNSHVSGTDAVGAMIVAGPEGFVKNAYRKFNIKGAQHQTPLIDPSGRAEKNELSDRAQEPYSAGDDFAMMREVLMRRFSRAMKEDPDRALGQWPDLLLIDGGLGQLNATIAVLEELGIDDVAIAGVAKGPNRNAGRERIFMTNQPPLSLEPRDPVLYFIQRLRDEAHRFAIGTHRKKRGKSSQKSTLDEIPGIGGKRKKALLHHFGAASAVAEAGREDLAVVDGISAATAGKIYDWFHPHG
jgi:excinuclease ABC subunit C